jgi:hypothetical protein
MFGTAKGATGRYRSTGPNGQPRTDLHALESRLDRLEGDLDSVLAGGAPSAAPLTRRALVSRWLIVGGIVLIAAAIVLAIF